MSLEKQRTKGEVIVSITQVMPEGIRVVGETTGES
jgi:hypothetical protein